MCRIFYFTAIIFFVLSCNNQKSTEGYEEKILSIEEMEQAEPLNFLVTEGTYRESFWGKELKISGEIKNNGTVATYKDVALRISYYSKTNSLISSEDKMIYEIFPPNSTVKFETVVNNYYNVHSINWIIVGAKVN